MKCRLCDEVILSEMDARHFFKTGTILRPPNVDPVFAGLSFLSLPLMINGGIHMLTCKAHKTN